MGRGAKAGVVAQTADDEDGDAWQALPKQQQHGRETVEIAGRIGHDGVEMALHGPLEAGLALQGCRVEVEAVLGFFVEQKRPVFMALKGCFSGNTR